MLGSLARWLRTLGYDTLYPGPLDDGELKAIALREGRVLLTRDGELSRSTTGALAIASDRLDDQLRQVVEAMGLTVDSPISRCSLCNTVLEEATVEEAGAAVPSGVLGRHREFWRCTTCGRFYWQGTHWENMMARIRDLRSTASHSQGVKDLGP